MFGAVLVRPTLPGSFKIIVPPLGLGYTAAAMKSRNIDTSIYDAWLYYNTPEQAAKMIGKTHDPEIIGVQFFFDTVDWACEFIRLVKKECVNAAIIAGGPYFSTFNSKEINVIAKNIGVDEVYQGEAEKHFGGSDPVDLDQFPVPAWEEMYLPAYWPHMQPATDSLRGKRPATILTSRGCPYRCTFCAGHVTHGRAFRARSVVNVIEEIKYLQVKWGVDEIWFQDDNALLDYDRAMELIEKIIPLKVHLRFPNGIRTENLDAAMVRTMKRAGTYFVGVGIESGSPRVLKECKKHLNLEDIRDKIELLKRHKIMVDGFFLVGLPTESEKDINDTIDYAISLPLDRAQIGVFEKYPGSEDYTKVINMEPSLITRKHKEFMLKFYLRPRILWSLFRHCNVRQVKALWNHPLIRKWTGREHHIFVLEL